MAKLTRYNSFEALKSDAPATKATSKERDEAHAAFEKFVQLLQREMEAKEKLKTSDGQ
jgi:hypothetical protein